MFCDGDDDDVESGDQGSSPSAIGPRQAAAFHRSFCTASPLLQPSSQPTQACTHFNNIISFFCLQSQPFKNFCTASPRPTLLANPSLHALEQFHFIEVLKNQPFTELFAPAAPSLPYPSSHALQQYYFCFKNQPFKELFAPAAASLPNPSSHALQQYSF